MEAIFSSETSVDFQRTTRNYIPNYRILFEDACYTKFSIFPLLSLLPVQIFFSAPFLRVPSVYILPAGKDITFHAHRKQRMKLYFAY
jgi:hypothetical protein